LIANIWKDGVMSEPGESTAPVTLPAPGARVVVRYLIPGGQATDALGELLSADGVTVIVNGVRGIERIPVGSIVAAKEVPPRPPRRPSRGTGTA
jgi:hypothetical protein